MADNKAVRQRSYGIHENVPGNGLDDVFHKFRAVRFDALPLLCAADALIGDGIAAEFIDPPS